jgi:hypothetical protein
MDIGEPVKEVEFEDPAAVPAPAEPTTPVPVEEPVSMPVEEPVGV